METPARVHQPQGACMKHVDLSRHLPCLLIAFALMVSSTLSTSYGNQDTYYIEIYDDTIERSLFSAPISSGETITLKYIHSVEKTPVFETYVMDADGRIYLSQTTVESSGYGLPEPQPGKRFYFNNGQVTFFGLHMEIPHLFLRVSYLNDMLILFKDHKLNLPRLTPRGDRVEIRIKAGKPRLE